MSNETPENVAEIATVPDAISLSTTVLIGTILGGEQPTALVRLQSGRIRSLNPGDRLDTRRIRAIQEGRVLLERQGAITELRLLDAA